MKANPFKPNSPINPGMFVGRLDELKRLEHALIQTRVDAPAHFMVTGERGIGKTSLLLYLNYVARGDIALEGETLRFLVLNLDVDASTTQLGLIQRIQMHLDNELGKTETARSFLKDAWSLVQRVRIMDSSISTAPCSTSDEVLLDEFALSLAKVVKKTCDKEAVTLFSTEYDGILLLIDEADNCSANLQLGSLLKLLLERLQKQNCNRVLVGLAGLPDLRHKLQISHPSSLRIFEEIPLERLTPTEVGRIISICINKANEINSLKTNISDEAKNILIGLSEGYPHFVQQFGFSAFNYDSDNNIDKNDVNHSAFGTRGALELIGERYYRTDFYNKIHQESYRQVLRVMANDLDGWVTRSKIRSKFKGNDSTLNNALKALRDRHIILSKEGEKGVYRLQHKGFALWIKLYADPDFFKTVEQELSRDTNIANHTEQANQPDTE
jgi:hypothetical protein